MELSLQIIQDLAPDQSSLGAAKKLLKPTGWPMLGRATSLKDLIAYPVDSVMNSTLFEQH